MDEMSEECELSESTPRPIRGRCSIADCIELLYSDEWETYFGDHDNSRIYVSWHEDGLDPYEVFDDVESAVGFLFTKDFEDKYEVGEISVHNGNIDYPWVRLNISLISKNVNRTS